MRLPIGASMAGTLFLVSSMLTWPLSGQSLAQERPSSVCRPAAQRTGDVGCWITASVPPAAGASHNLLASRQLSNPRRCRSSKAAARHGNGGVSGKVWLFTIAEKGWKPTGGQRIAEVGPLYVNAGVEYHRPIHGSHVHSRHDVKHSSPRWWPRLHCAASITQPVSKLQTARSLGRRATASSSRLVCL